jgi:hypothetical protein
MATEEDVIALQNTFYVPEPENIFYIPENLFYIPKYSEHILHT